MLIISVLRKIQAKTQAISGGVWKSTSIPKGAYRYDKDSVFCPAIRIITNASKNHQETFKVVLVTIMIDLPVIPVFIFLRFRGGTAEPVSINCPSSSLLSTSFLTSSQNCGAICHSSINLGVLREQQCPKST